MLCLISSLSVVILAATSYRTDDGTGLFWAKKFCRPGGAPARSQADGQWISCFETSHDSSCRSAAEEPAQRRSTKAPWPYSDVAIPYTLYVAAAGLKQLFFNFNQVKDQVGCCRAPPLCPKRMRLALSPQKSSLSGDLGAGFNGTWTLNERRRIGHMWQRALWHSLSSAHCDRQRRGWP